MGDFSAASRPHRVRLEIAVQPELRLSSYRATFRQVLTELVRQAGSQALVGRILVTASRSGEWVQVSVSDDAIGADQRAREDALRSIEHLLAQQGGELEITSWPDQGVTVLALWLETGPAEPGQGRAPTVARERVSTG